MEHHDGSHFWAVYAMDIDVAMAVAYGISFVFHWEKGDARTRGKYVVDLEHVPDGMGEKERARLRARAMKAVLTHRKEGGYRCWVDNDASSQ